MKMAKQVALTLKYNIANLPKVCGKSMTSSKREVIGRPMHSSVGRPTCAIPVIKNYFSISRGSEQLLPTPPLDQQLNEIK